MEPGGQSHNTENASELQRRAAATIARRKVLAAYSHSAEEPANRPAATTTPSQLKDTKINPTANAESFKQYHAAWQTYYQKYYSQYYATAAKNYVEKERLKDARAKAEEEELLGKHAGQASAQSGMLKKIVQQKATDSARKGKHMRRYIPIFAGVFVVLFILFLQYNRLIFAPIMAYISPVANTDLTKIESVDPTITTVVSPEPRLIIPKLNIDVPVSFGIPLSEVNNAMVTGVAHFRVAGASAFPGELGNTVISGHSAGDIYGTAPYKFIFAGLERLEQNDLIYINYNSVRYTYKLVKKSVVTPNDVAAVTEKFDKPMVILITCTPLGTSTHRLLVFGEQISPAVDGNTISNETPVDDDSKPVNEILPSNEPTFFEGIWNWLTGR